MRENLHRFFRAARGAGVRLSPAESIDAMRAVSKVGFTDRAVLRDTFLLTLAKTQDEKKALGDCFDLFFDQPEPQAPAEDGKSDEQDQSGSSPSSGQSDDASGGDEQAEGLGQVAQMLLAQDRNQISAAIANAASAASLLSCARCSGAGGPPWASRNPGAGPGCTPGRAFAWPAPRFITRPTTAAFASRSRRKT